MIVAIVKNKQLVRLPPIIAHLRPTLSMNKMQHNCATKASTEDIPWYLSVSLVEIPIWLKIVCKAKRSSQYSVSDIIMGGYHLITYRTVILDRGHSSHLNTSLDSADEHEAAEGGLVLEQLHIRLGSIFVLVLDRVADLVILGAHPSVIFVAVGMEPGKSLETFLGLAVVDEPSAVTSAYNQNQPR
jgi:hypothetical protein